MLDEEDFVEPFEQSGSHRAPGRSAYKVTAPRGKRKESRRPVPYDKPFNHPSNYVYPHNHPLRTGIPNKLYHVCDRVAPVADAIAAMVYARNNSYMQAFRKEQEMRKAASNPTAPVVFKEAKPKPIRIEEHPNPSAFFDGAVDHLNRTPSQQIEEENSKPKECPCCETSLTSSNVELTTDKDAFICMGCGTVVSRGVQTHTHRDKNCQESEDTTIRAEAVYEPKRHKYEEPAPSAEDSRKERMREQSNVFVSMRRSKELGTGFVHQQLNRKAAAEVRKEGVVTASNPEGWSPTERSKGDQLMRELEKIIVSQRPVAQPICFHLRSQTAGLWSRVVTHERICCGSVMCKKKLSGRTLKSIAEAAFDYHLDTLLHSADDSPNITYEQVRTLKEKWTSRKKQLNAHMVSTRAMVSLILEHDVCTPCTESVSTTPNTPAQDSDLSQPQSPSLVHSPERMLPAKLPRNDSLIPSSKDEVPRAATPLGSDLSPLLAFRQSVLRVHRLFQSTVPKTVKEKAIELLSDNQFTNALYDSDAAPLGQEAKSAFALLTALEHTRPKNGKERVKDLNILSLINISEEEAASFVASVRSILPDVWTSSSPPAEALDALF